MRRAEGEETFRAPRGHVTDRMTDAELANLIADCLTVRGVRGRVAPAEAGGLSVAAEAR